MKRLKLGTRNSKLALWQAYHVQELLNRSGISSEIVPIETKGDKILDVTLSKIGSKGVFTEEIEQMLADGHIDLAIHSAKDLPGKMNEKFEILAYTKREKVHDVVLSRNKNVTLQEASQNGLKVGTSSTRRTAFVHRYYPGAIVTDLRGNLQTRLQKLINGHADVMLLAYAGVHRMQMDEYISEHIDIEMFTPPSGQGSIAVQCLAVMNVEIKKYIAAAINDHHTAQCLHVERQFLVGMQAGCSVPVFCHANFIDQERIFVRGGILSLDGKKMVIQYMTIPAGNAGKAGEILAKKVLRTGGSEILNEIKI